ATSGGASPFGQSWTLSGKSGRPCRFTYAATSNACWSVNVPGWSNGMLSLMNAAAVRTRAIPAPMLYECAPHTGGATAVPSPSAPWHLTQLVAYTRAPAAVSALRAAHFASRLDMGAGATGTARDRNHRYATMSRMSAPSAGSGRPV